MSTKETRIKRVTKEDLAETLDTLGENVKGHHFAHALSDNADYTVEYGYTLPTMTFTEPEDGDDLLGADLDSLQTDVTIADGLIAATLPYKEDYTGFSGDEKLQEGHYIALKATTSSKLAYITFRETDEDGDIVETVCKVYDEDESTTYDGVIIKRIKADDMLDIIVTYKDGDEETVKNFKCDFTYEPKDEDDS